MPGAASGRSVCLHVWAPPGALPRWLGEVLEGLDGQAGPDGPPGLVLQLRREAAVPRRASWLQRAFSARVPALGAWQPGVAAGQRLAQWEDGPTAAPDIVWRLHTDLAADLPADLPVSQGPDGAGLAGPAPLSSALPLPPGTPVAPLQWRLMGADGHALGARWPLLAAITAGRGIGLRLLERAATPDAAQGPGPWALRRSLHVAAPACYAAGLAGLAPAVLRLLRQTLVDVALETPLPVAAGTAPAGRADAVDSPTDTPADTPTDGSTDSPASALRCAWRGRWRAWRRRQRDRWLSESWRLGVIDAPLQRLLLPGPLPPVQWLTAPSAQGYWADPFGVPGDDHRLICEFFDWGSAVGRIELLHVAHPGQPPRRQPLALGGGRHVSFPQLLDLGGRRLGVAETMAMRQCMLYQIDTTGQWQPLWPLLRGVAAADPALFEWEGRYWLAYTDADLGEHDNLCLHHADQLEGPWQPHANNPVKVDICGARMAGALFWHGGALHRPGQDCLQTYGAATVLHRIVRLTPACFEEAVVQRVAPAPGSDCPHGLHTVNAWGPRTLVDGKRMAFEPRALLRKLRQRRQAASCRGGAAAGASGTSTGTGTGKGFGDGFGEGISEGISEGFGEGIGEEFGEGLGDGLGLAAGHVFVYVPHLRTGGGEISMLRLAHGFAAAGWRVDLVVHTLRTQELPVPPGVQVTTLGCEGTAAALWPLVRALRQQRPQWLLSAFAHTNIAATLALALARSGTRGVLSEHAPLSLQMQQHGGWRWRLLPPLVRWAYPRAAAVVAVSRGVGDDLQRLAGPALAPVVIGNPVLAPGFEAEMAEPPDHPWLRDPALQVVLSVCRLAPEKDLPTLLRAFAAVHRTRPAARLLLAGEGPERARLQALRAELGLQDVVQLPGRTGQPLRWMHRAAVFVLASRFEGFGNVLIEALACGTPVVATDCPVGPRELLQDGRLGALVPVGDVAAMAHQIGLALAQRVLPPGAREAALAYTQAAASAAYLRLFDPAWGAAAAPDAAVASGPRPC